MFYKKGFTEKTHFAAGRVAALQPPGGPWQRQRRSLCTPRASPQGWRCTGLRGDTSSRVFVDHGSADGLRR